MEKLRLQRCYIEKSIELYYNKTHPVVCHKAVDLLARIAIYYSTHEAEIFLLEREFKLKKAIHDCPNNGVTVDAALAWYNLLELLTGK